jgi:hypothetical protein
MEKKRWYQLISCSTGFVVIESTYDHRNFNLKDLYTMAWGFTTKAEALAFIRKHLDGADG